MGFFQADGGAARNRRRVLKRAAGDVAHPERAHELEAGEAVEVLRMPFPQQRIRRSLADARVFHHCIAETIDHCGNGESAAETIVERGFYLRSGRGFRRRLVVGDAGFDHDGLQGGAGCADAFRGNAPRRAGFRRLRAPYPPATCRHSRAERSTALRPAPGGRQVAGGTGRFFLCTAAVRAGQRSGTQRSTPRRTQRTAGNLPAQSRRTRHDASSFTGRPASCRRYGALLAPAPRV